MQDGQNVAADPDTSGARHMLESSQFAFELAAGAGGIFVVDSVHTGGLGVGRKLFDDACR